MSGLRQFLDLLVRLYVWAIIARALMTWVRPRTYNRTYYDIERVLRRLTEPVLAPMRGVFPMSGVDWSPLIAIILIQVVWNFLAPYVPL